MKLVYAVADRLLNLGPWIVFGCLLWIMVWVGYQ